jgi:putative transposase
LIEEGNKAIPVKRQCELLGLARSTRYYHPQPISAEDVELMNLLDWYNKRCPFHGSRRLTAWLRTQGWLVNRKRISRLMRLMGLEAIYPKPRLSRGRKDHKKYPYLLSGVEVTRVNQVWSTDITYIRLHSGFLYLVAVMDWYSRHVLAWETSICLDSDFCVRALERALSRGCPEIFNTDQGVQFTSENFVEVLENRGIRVSMDGKGRALDNVFVERLWRSVKVEDVYLKDYRSVIKAVEGPGKYFRFYNENRLHQSLGYRTPGSVYREGDLKERRIANT